jgi:hypothetical protein
VSEMGDMKFTTAGDMMGIDYDELVAKYDNQTKLDIAAWVLSKIDDHGENPGSFRHLIYGLMGFGVEAYVPLYEAGGMNITNELDYSRASTLLDIIKEQQIENQKLKEFAGICDEPGCFNGASCGWPTSDGGYRRTCYEHSNFNKNNE